MRPGARGRRPGVRVAAAVAVAAAMGGIALWAQQDGASNSTPADPLLKAMHDELERSRKITISNLEPPYFVQYLLDESENFNISATLGGVISRRRDHVREPQVQVRVGDYKFDNTNYTGSGFNFGTRYDLGRFPLDDTYPVLRRYFWLYTDSAYKSAIEALSRKRAALRNITQTDQLNDFAHADPVQHVRPFQRFPIDEDEWTRRVRAVSALFAQYPEVRNSNVEMEASSGGYILANSEGTEVREPENSVYLRVRATAQSSDGMPLREAVTFHALDPGHMPPEPEMMRAVNAMAQNLTALARAPKGEDYNGPVLFEGSAGAQLLAELLGRNLAMTRRPVSDGGRGGGGAAASELDGRLGARVLPESFTVVDDPTQKEWRGRPLFGAYEVDREGVAPSPLKVVEKGVLKNYLLTRQPVRGFEGSNGRARLPGPYGASLATISNLFVSSSETMPAAEMKKKLLELIQTRSKPYGIIVRKMDYPSTATIDEARRIMAAEQSNRPVSVPLMVYKVFPDGHEELVRGLRFRGLNVRSLKDILTAGDDSTVFEFMDNAAPFALVGAANFTAEACIVAPSLLIDDLDLHPIEEEQPKLPVVSPPDMSR